MTIIELLEDDHRAIDDLLARACASEPIDLQLYDRFRERLLRHIGWEEKIVFRAAAEARGAALPEAATLRRDHGRIAALLTRRPTEDSIAELRAILERHNHLEEGGVSAECQRVLADQNDALVERMRAAPVVPLAPFYEGPIPLPDRGRD